MFQNNLKALRMKKGLSQGELAIRLNVVRQTISKWEKGVSVPDAETLIKLADLLDSSVNDLLGSGVAPEDSNDLDKIAEQLVRVNEQLAIKNNRARRIWKVVVITIAVFVFPCKALRDEGTSYHYLPPERFVEVSEKARFAIEQTMKNHNLPYLEVVTWSTDGFYRETKEKVAYRKSEGCSVVEMECSALAACAKMRGAIWGELLFTADTLAEAERYDERNWGDDSAAYALKLCIEAIKYI